MADDTYRYQHCLDHGELSLYVPRELSQADVEDMKAHFDLIVKQAERRAKPSMNRAGG